MCPHNKNTSLGDREHGIGLKSANLWVHRAKKSQEKYRRVEQLAARESHSLKVVGSSPSPATLRAGFESGYPLRRISKINLATGIK